MRLFLDLVHFTGRKTKAQRGQALPKVTQLANPNCAATEMRLTVVRTLTTEGTSVQQALGSVTQPSKQFTAPCTGASPENEWAHLHSKKEGGPKTGSFAL